MPFHVPHFGLSACLRGFLVAWVAIAANALAATPEVGIADTPLYGAHASVHPNMLLSLSVEFPTAGIAYRSDEGTYNRTASYIGYFNPLKCYVYVGGNTSVANYVYVDDESDTASGYFAASKVADTTTHECGGDSFSGNFMNWVASSSIDMVRYALTGGDRIVDTATSTVLQRAYLPDFFYADGSFFPRRTVSQGGNVSAPNQVTPFDVATLHIVSCRTRILFSDQAKDDETCTTSPFNGNSKELAKGNKRLGEYLVRVQVCDDAEGPARTDLCKSYGGHYKPVGEMQRYADKIRFAAMGYLNDDSVGRYGGVLRAPMKYVGASKYEQPGFAEADNERREWDPATGIFVANPESYTDSDDGSQHSGVINYLNTFGRDGIYKTYDPVGELYYEGIRYLQGKQPTPQAISDIAGKKGKFQVVESWTDPVVASCQDNYIVSIADVNTHWDRYIPGNTRTTLNSGASANDSARPTEPAVSGKTPELNVMTWTRKIGELESSSAYGNKSPRSGLANLDMLDTGSEGHGSYYMAGLAYWANTNDIRLDKPVRVKTFAIDVDEQGNGLVDGNDRAIAPRDSQLFLAAKYGGFDDRNDDDNPFVTLDSDDKTVITGNDKEWDSDGDGVPDNYFLAGQPQALIDSVRKIFANLPEGSGTTSGVAISGAKVLADGGYVYQPGFDATRWSGSLERLKVSLDSSGQISIATTADWDAGEVLSGTTAKAADPAPAARRIFTSSTDAGDTFTTNEFLWSSLTAAQKTMLNTDPVSGSSDGLGEDRLAYLRGMRDKEEGTNGGVFRVRASALGDIIHSNPVYVGAPSLKMQGAGYDTFYEAYKNRTKAVYVGANDGMLHAFNADDGTELFAYVPDMLMSGLNKLTAPTYAHQPYVDGVIEVAEAQVNGAWKTVLVSGLGGGAQGVFALDVTNPTSFAKNGTAMWEFSDSDDPGIGNVLGTPLIAKFRTGTSKGVAQYRYFAVVASGFNNYQDDGVGKFDPDAPGVLYLLALDKSRSAPWALNVNYYKFELPIADPALQNGLSTPAFVVGSDGAVRYAYAGDLQGNLWRLDFSGDAPWTAARGEKPDTPLFVAKDKKDKRQPITTQPRVVYAPGGYLVLFGTGKFVEDADTATASYMPQSFYAIHDTTSDDDKPVTRADLVERNVEASSGSTSLDITGSTFVYGTDDDGKRGWYFDFLDAGTTGERSVTDPLVAYGRLFFNSLVPGTDPCAPGGGRSYSLDVLTGLPVGGEATGAMSTVGYLGTPVLLDAGTSDTGDRNAIGKRATTRKYSVFNFGTGDAHGNKVASTQDKAIEVVRPAGRFSWREVLNWQELRKAFGQ